MRPAVLYIPYDTSPKEKTGDIITFTQFEEKNLLSETRNDTESGNKSDDDTTLETLIIKEKIDVMSPGDESDAEHIYAYGYIRRYL